MIEIELIDDGKERYTLQSNTSVIGRRYDNNAEAIRVIKPRIEADSVCKMYISNNDNVIDIIEVKDKPIKIRNVVTQFPMVKIGFSFSRADGYVKNSEAKSFYLLDAIQPVGFVPVDPEIKQKLDKVIQYAFVDVRWSGTEYNTLEFLDSSDDVSKQIELSPFVQSQSDLAETDDSKETFVKGKSTKNLANEGEDGTSKYATIKYVEDAINLAITNTLNTEV